MGVRGVGAGCLGVSIMWVVWVVWLCEGSVRGCMDVWGGMGGACLGCVFGVES